MAITALTDVETLEVSLVPEGANLKKRFPVLKSSETKMSDILHAVIDAPSSEDTKFDQVVKSSALGENAEAAEAIKGAMKILNAYSDSISPADALGVLAEGFGVQKAEYKKAEEEEEDAEKASEFEEGKESEGAKLSDEGELDKASEFEEGKESEGTKLSDEGELDKASEFEEGEESEGTKLSDEDEIEKSLEALPANARKQITALWKSNREHVAKAEKLEKALKVERDERLRKEFVEKAKTDFPYVPGKSSEEVGLMLKSLHVLAPKIAEDIEGIFKSVSATIEKAGLLQELGSGMTNRGDGASAYAKLDGMARESVSKSGGSYAKAFETVMQNNPELYSQYLDEQGQ